MRDSSGTKNQPQYSSSGAPADAADMSEIANYAAYNGNIKIDVDSVRTGLSGADLWDGLFFFSTDLGIMWQNRTSGGWKKFDTVERTYDVFDFPTVQAAGTTLKTVAFASRPYITTVDVDLPTQVGNGGGSAGTFYVDIAAPSATVVGPAVQPYSVASGAWEAIAQAARLTIPASTAVTLTLTSAGSANGIWHGAVRTVRAPQ